MSEVFGYLDLVSWMVGLIFIFHVYILQAESLVKAQQDMGETMGELGLAFVKLTKLETEGAMFESQTIRATDMKNVATAAVKASRLYRELNAQTVKHLVWYTSFSIYWLLSYISHTMRTYFMCKRSHS